MNKAPQIHMFQDVYSCSSIDTYTLTVHLDLPVHIALRYQPRTYVLSLSFTYRQHVRIKSFRRLIIWASGPWEERIFCVIKAFIIKHYFVLWFNVCAPFSTLILKQNLDVVNCVCFIVVVSLLLLLLLRMLFAFFSNTLLCNLFVCYFNGLLTRLFFPSFINNFSCLLLHCL